MAVPNPKLNRHLDIARWLVGVLEGGIKLPLIGKNIGLDPILGLIPIVGDWIGLVLGMYLVWVAVRYQLPNHVISSMCRNLLVDALIGIVPVAGDVFDFFWKANRSNLKLLEKAIAQGAYGKKFQQSSSYVPMDDDIEAVPSVVDVVAEPVSAV